MNVAYQVAGDSPADLVYVGGWMSHLEVAREDSVIARLQSRLCRAEPTS